MSETSQQIDFMNASLAPAKVDQDVLKIARQLVKDSRSELARNLAIMDAEGGDSDFPSFLEGLEAPYSPDDRKAA